MAEHQRSRTSNSHTRSQFISDIKQSAQPGRTNYGAVVTDHKNHPAHTQEEKAGTNFVFGRRRTSSAASSLISSGLSSLADDLSNDQWLGERGTSWRERSPNQLLSGSAVAWISDSDADGLILPREGSVVHDDLRSSPGSSRLSSVASDAKGCPPPKERILAMASPPSAEGRLKSPDFVVSSRGRSVFSLAPGFTASAFEEDSRLYQTQALSASARREVDGPEEDDGGEARVPLHSAEEPSNQIAESSPPERFSNSPLGEVTVGDQVRTFAGVKMHTKLLRGAFAMALTVQTVGIVTEILIGSGGPTTDLLAIVTPVLGFWALFSNNPFRYSVYLCVALLTILMSTVRSVDLLVHAPSVVAVLQRQAQITRQQITNSTSAVAEPGAHAGPATVMLGPPPAVSSAALRWQGVVILITLLGGLIPGAFFAWQLQATYQRKLRNDVLACVADREPYDDDFIDDPEQGTRRPSRRRLGGPGQAMEESAPPAEEFEPYGSQNVAQEQPGFQLFKGTHVTKEVHR